MMVALRKESVDRNRRGNDLNALPAQSLSARRAWIEIGSQGNAVIIDNKVALRKESVDRNSMVCVRSISCLVALRKESVDRNQRCQF